MKKLLLLSAVLLGAVSASQAGTHFSLGIGLPLPPLPGVVIRAPAPVYAPVVYAPAPVYRAPLCAAPVVVAPPTVYFGYGGYGCAPGYGYYSYRGYPDYRYGHGYAYHRYGHYRGGHYRW